MSLCQRDKQPPVKQYAVEQLGNHKHYEQKKYEMFPIIYIDI